MAQSNKQNPFELLQQLERLGRDHAAELPTQEEVRLEWAGIGFRLGGGRYVAPLDEVTEILTYPDLARVPHTKSWVRGIANVRGNLLPIMDLSGYLGKRPVAVTRVSRVLVMDHEGVFAGLLVDEVLGMRHFYQEERSEATGDVDEAIAPYINGSYKRSDGVWPVFSMLRLAEHPQFLKVAS
jgi:twitching motility protein PilI